ncbi:phage integrase family protein [Burkholderia gladioli]|uniref:phage integrase family protein n=1 Tax=Burkholderia gladioli TaxID=28095 RepID=UPI001F155B12|nr:phage integrase family protein [Burkholderia gladioli]
MKPGSLPARRTPAAPMPPVAPMAPLARRRCRPRSTFRDAVDPDHVYSERDLLTLYLETYPPARSPAIDRKVARNRRLRERQDAALARVEAAIVEAPRPDQLLGGWFAPFLVTRLAEAGVTTFEQLLGLIRRRRQRWYAAVPRLDNVGFSLSDYMVCV